MNPQELRWPHEYIADLPGAAGHRLDRQMLIWKSNFQALVDGLYIQLGQRSPLIERERTEAYINGPENGRLYDKFTFGEAVRSIGYISPKQVFAPKRGNLAEVEAELEATFPNPDETLLFKPAYGFQGWGIQTVPNRSAAIPLLRARNEARSDLVQEYIPSAREFRYVIHRAGDETYRIAYEKRVPVVFPDGTQRLGSLIQQDPTIPDHAKTALLKIHAKKLHEIPHENPDGLRLAPTGNISQGAYGVLPNDEEVNKIDAFMLQFIEDLERHLGISLVAMCFDIGLLQDNFENLRENTVFYEYNEPAMMGLDGYFTSLGLSKSERTDLEKRFFRSMRIHRWRQNSPKQS